MNLKSSVNELGETVTQIFHAISGEKRTFSGIITASIKEGSELKMKTVDGRMLIVNKKNLFITEVFSENKDPRKAN
jgi:hypothetical protein